MRRPTRTITLKLPARLASRLDSAARKRSTTRSAVIRAALEGHLDGKEGPRSCLDLARDLAGSIDGGPADLSYNRKHLEGFGR